MTQAYAEVSMARTGWPRSFVRSKWAELAIVFVSAVCYYLTRQVTFTIYPTVSIRICAVFAYVPMLFVSWKYSLVVPMLVFFTSPEPFGSFFGLLAGTQTAYFAGRLFGKYRVLALVFATLAANLAAWYTRVFMGIIPSATVGFAAYMVKATVTAMAIVLMAPVMLKALEKTHLIDFNKGQ